MFRKKQIIMIIAIVAAVLVAAAVVLLTLPKVPSDKPSGEPSSSAVDALTPTVGERVTFTATVLNIRDGAVLVNANGTLCWVKTGVQSDVPVPMIKIGDAIKVVYDGRIAESYPGQINFVYEIHKPDGSFPMLTYKFSPKISGRKTLTQVTEQCDLGGAVYLYGLNGVDVTVEGQTMSLQQALSIGIVSVEYWLSQAQMDAMSGKCELLEYKDGGSKLYQYRDYAILKMNTITGDKTLYIGSTDLSISTVKALWETNDDPPVKITASQNEQSQPRRVSTWRTAMETDYIIYYGDVDSVQVKTTEGYEDLFDALRTDRVDMDSFRSELQNLAQEGYPQTKVICGDGISDGAPYTETRIMFPDFTVTFTGYQDRREVLFSSPRGAGFSQSVKERIAAECANYPLTIKKSASATVTKVTRPEWDLGYDVCYYNIDSASVMLDGKAVDLLDAVSQGKISFEQLLEDADSLGDWIYNTEYRDGGSVLYRFDKYAILKRHTLKGDETLYIGTADLTPNVV